MKFTREYMLEEIAEIIGAKMDGDPDFPVFGMNEIHVVVPGDLVFVDHSKYYDKALNSAATVILINEEVSCPPGKALLISDDPFRDFNKLTHYFRPFKKSESAISPSSSIGRDTIIQPNCFVGNHVRIGNNCIIHPNVTIYDYTIIGDNVTVHSGSVLGAEAFYYKKRKDGFDKLKSGGRLIIHNDVDIGASCTIDRGVSGDTTIGSGSKLDNQVHIAHDTVLGQRVLIASQVGIAGCVIVEDDVTIWGQVGIRSDVRIGKGAVILAQSGVSKTLKGGKTYFGCPAEEVGIKYKELAASRTLPSILEKLKKLK